MRLTKTCTVCKIERAREFFNSAPSRKDGLGYKCKVCLAEIEEARKPMRRARANKWYAENKDRAPTHQVNTKMCTKCLKIKDAKEFYERSISVDGLSSICITCKSDYEVVRWEKKGPSKRAYLRDWMRENREWINAYNRSREAKKRGAGVHTAEETLQMLEQQSFLCANRYCRADLRVVKKQLDHIVPIAKNGRNTIENLQWLCAKCNRNKSDKDLMDWYVEQERRLIAEMLA